MNDVRTANWNACALPSATEIKIKMWNKQREKREQNRQTKRNIVAPLMLSSTTTTTTPSSFGLLLLPLTPQRAAFILHSSIYRFLFRFFIVFFFGFSHHILFCTSRFWLFVRAVRRLIAVDLPSSRTHKFKIRNVNSCDDQVNASCAD